MSACELSPCFCFASVLSQLEGKKKKVGGLKGTGFFSLMGVTVTISVAVRVLTGLRAGDVSCRGKNTMIAMHAHGFNLKSINY